MTLLLLFPDLPAAMPKAAAMAFIVYWEPVRSFMRKHITIFAVGVALVIALFAGVTYFVNRHAGQRHEAMFQRQQVLQVLLAKQAMDDRVGWIFGEMDIFRTHSLPEFIKGKRDVESLTALFRSEQTVRRENLCMLFTDRSRHPILTVFPKTEKGRIAQRLARQWIDTYWQDLLASNRGRWIPPFGIVDGFQMMGILLPIRINGDLKGVLSVVLDLQPMVERYIAPMRSGQYGAGYLIDQRGTILFDHEKQIIGRNVFDGMHANYPDLKRVDKHLVQAPLGTDEYRFTVQRGGRESRKLIAWNSVAVGQQKLVICLSAPDLEISQTLFGLRIQSILSGALLAVVLLALSSFFFRSRQGVLEESNKQLHHRIEERTAELLESRELYSKLMAALPDIVVRMDLEGKIQFINSVALQISGYERQELMGRSMLDFIDPEDHERVVENTIRMAEGQLGPKEYRLVMKDGSKVPFEVNGDLLRDKNGTAYGIVQVCRDINKRVQLEKEQQQLTLRLHKAEKMEALGTLAGGVAHDLNNILSGLVSYPDLLLLDMPEDSPFRETVLTIKNSGQKAAAIVQDLLTLARRGVATEAVVDLNAVVSEFMQSPEFNSLRAFHHGVEFAADLHPALLPILGSPVHLSKTVLNLVANAAESIAGLGRVVISTRNQYIDRPVRGYEDVQEGDYVLLQVSDSGAGISAEDMDRIFEPFYTRKTMGRSGTGLGMAVVWGTVKDHKGYIDIRSTQGHGTHCDLYFPVTRREPEMDQAPVLLDACGGSETILVVDDVASQRDIAAKILRRLGYTVATAAGGEEAAAFLTENEADLVVLDMIMYPGIDGLETYQRILAIRPGQKAIFVSGFSETERVRHAQRLGAGAYVQKPYVLDTLGRAVRFELDRQ